MRLICLFSLIALLLTACDSQPYHEILLSKGGANDVFGSIINDNQILIVRQELGVEHIRGFHSSLILHTIDSNEDALLFQSGTLPGKNDTSKMMVIDGPPRLTHDDAVEFSVVESSEMEFMPQNTMYIATINLSTKELEFKKSNHKKETEFDELGNVVAEDYSRREITIGKSTIIIESNFSQGYKRVIKGNSIIAEMEPTHDFFFNKDSILFESNRHVFHRLLESGEQTEIFSPSHMNTIKTIYGISDDSNILIETKQGNFFYYSIPHDSWLPIAKNDGATVLIPPKFNNIGTIIHDGSTHVLLKRANKNTGDGALYLFTKTGKGSPIKGKEVPALDPPQASGNEVRVIGTRKGNLAPDFSLTTTEGDVINLASQMQKGKWTVFYSWATWCPQCSREFPSIKEALRDVNPANLEFIAIDMDLSENDAMISNYMGGKDLNLQSAMATSEFLKDYRMRSTTMKVIIDPQGVVQYSGSGVLSKEHWKTIFLVGT